MERDEHKSKVIAYFKTNEPYTDGLYADQEFWSSLDEVLYSMSELGLWFDEIDSVSKEQVMLCWRIIEKIKTDGFPEELRM